MVYLASDHGGFLTKERVKAFLIRQGIQTKDLGPFSFQDDDDYPDYVLPLAELVVSQKAKGIIACRNGQGAAIAANKVSGIRAAVCWNQACAASARTDDNTNILSLPADYLDTQQTEQVVMAWLSTPFSHD